MAQYFELEEWKKIRKRLERLPFNEIIRIAEAGGLNFYGKGDKTDYLSAMDEIDKDILLRELETIEKSNRIAKKKPLIF